MAGKMKTKQIKRFLELNEQFIKENRVVKKSKKGCLIIEAEKDFKSFKEFLQYVGTFLIILGTSIVITSLIMIAVSVIINLIKGL